MSNLQRGKIIAEQEDCKLILHEDGHVATWNRLIFDGQHTNAWKSIDTGTPEEAIEVYPGYRSPILNASQEG